MRSDAQQNREALLSVARTLIAENGASVSLRAIAAEAGVGIATLYRHFPTRGDLFLALVMQMSAEGLAAMDRALEQWDADPEAAWRTFIIELAQTHLGAQLVAVAEEDPEFATSERVSSARAHRLARFDPILVRARESGLIGDIDAMRLIVGVAAATRPLPAFVEQQIPDLHEWLIDAYIRGIRS
ncbi:TetR/AcrR family transcriptional regulator [uncultured Brevibacterium sp.]|uniref:TetR/AcrR family transcriptional regulator n=1 Tax=uncultured Brevibacterium sp. TaxID=189678 RepID=UPI0025E552C9|nr:TetR/AcrR family transcriptional regulator [uncultured Brevibacterium sp.]